MKKTIIFVVLENCLCIFCHFHLEVFSNPLFNQEFLKFFTCGRNVAVFNQVQGCSFLCNKMVIIDTLIEEFVKEK